MKTTIKPCSGFHHWIESIFFLSGMHDLGKLTKEPYVFLAASWKALSPYCC